MTTATPTTTLFVSDKEYANYGNVSTSLLVGVIAMTLLALALIDRLFDKRWHEQLIVTCFVLVTLSSVFACATFCYPRNTYYWKRISNYIIDIPLAPLGKIPFRKVTAVRNTFDKLNEKLEGKLRADFSDLDYQLMGVDPGVLAKTMCLQVGEDFWIPYEGIYSLAGRLEMASKYSSILLAVATFARIMARH